MSQQPGRVLLLVLLGLLLPGLLLVSCRGFPQEFRQEVRGTETSELIRADGPLKDPDNDNVVSVDRIVFVGTGGDLFTIKADGSDPQQLTGNNQLSPDVPEIPAPAEPQEAGARQISAAFLGQTLNFRQFYAWPTWSPDGAKLAASLVQVRSEREATVSIQIIDATSGRADTVYTNEVPALIADGVPHYLYWAPDGQSLGFIAATPRGLTLFVSSVDTPIARNQAPVAVETGAPLYFSWAEDSRGLLLHSGPEIKLVPSLADGESSLALGSNDGFRVPAYSPAGSSGGPRLAYATRNEDGGLLMVANSGALERKQAQPVLDVGAFSAFLWSPDGTRLAIADRVDPGGPTFQRLRVVSAKETGPEADEGRQADPQVDTIAAEDLLAFYWSPDGQRLAWVALNPEQRLFQWRVSSSDGADPKDLFRFQPSGEFFTLLSFFDQYAYSHSPWSPDSSQLVVAGSPEQAFERRNGHTPTGSRIFVLDVAGGDPPLEIAAGTLAFWSQN